MSDKSHLTESVSQDYVAMSDSNPIRLCQGVDLTLFGYVSLVSRADPHRGLTQISGIC
jgi:hypothetical protein